MNEMQIEHTLKRGISGFGVLADAKAEALLARILNEVDFAQQDANEEDARDLNDDELEMLAAAGVPRVNPNQRRVYP
ncbi:MAG: hypothetical protein IKG21_05085 [Atopobiaceae bacterium]|nr:hypothetical protein [Atopobiaceae bacterium]